MRLQAVRPAPIWGFCAAMGKVLRESGESAGTPLELNGVTVLQGCLDTAAQAALVEEVRAVVAVAPLVAQVTAGGRRMSVRMSAAGAFGWVSDAQGYRYAPERPGGGAWPPIPPMLLDLWGRLAGTDRTPESCLVNYYGADARMGLHRDSDEADMTQPVLSVSLGDDGLFRVGGPERRGPTRSVWLRSGDVVLLSGTGRRAYHGVDRIRFGSSALLERGGRLNLTLRVVT